MQNNCVYLFRDSKKGRVHYIGRGASVERALNHTSTTHNPGLASLIASGGYVVEVSGPYTAAEATAVEAALIAAIGHTPRNSLCNRREESSGTFRPLGVPPEYADRQAQRFDLSQLGRRTGGVLVVRIGPDAFADRGRPKLNPLEPDPSVIADNIVRWWDLGPLMQMWRGRVEEIPAVVLGAAGPPHHRYVPGALDIDRAALATTQPSSSGQYEIPLLAGHPDYVQDGDLDAAALRGCLIDGALFAQFRSDHIIWVDGEGTTRYATSPHLR